MNKNTTNTNNNSGLLTLCLTAGSRRQIITIQENNTEREQQVEATVEDLYEAATKAFANNSCWITTGETSLAGSIILIANCGKRKIRDGSFCGDIS